MAGGVRRFPGSRRGAAIVAALLAGGGAGAGIAVAVDGGGSTTTVQPAASAASSPAVLRSSQSLTASEIYARESAGVVDITVDEQGQSSGNLFGPRDVQGEGSGFVLDKSGDIVTNAHVVDGASKITVKFKNGTTATAKLVGSDDSTDVAVVHVDVAADKLTPLSLGDSSAIVPGEPVVAIGSPFGLPQSISSGIVSATGREIQAPDGSPIEDAIQTDATLNHGNSGGPLIDSSGAVVGLNSQIDSSTGGSDGVGFAVPSNTVSKIADQLIAHGSVQHAYLGVQIVTVDAAAAKALSVPQGAEVVQVVSGSPADKAGLKAGKATQSVGGQDYTTDGDVITAAGGKAITSSEQLRAAISAKNPGEKIDLTVVAGGKTRTVTVTLGTRPS
jgi:putative serine protease PepD